MAENEYDIVTVGGGLGGSSLAKVMAEKGARVLVLEREKEFKDRVRGEAMLPWGVAEAQELGICDLLRETCGHKARWFDFFLGPAQIMHRDLESTTPQKNPVLSFYHPEMQEILISAAAKAGAVVRRGAFVTEVRLGSPPSVTFQHEGMTAKLKRDSSLPLIAADPTRVPDHGMSGPDIPFDKETARAHFFGDV
jgi:menaquinone-9 beta-reductase